MATLVPESKTESYYLTNNRVDYLRSGLCWDIHVAWSSQLQGTCGRLSSDPHRTSEAESRAGRTYRCQPGSGTEGLQERKVSVHGARKTQWTVHGDRQTRLQYRPCWLVGRTDLITISFPTGHFPAVGLPPRPLFLAQLLAQH